MIFNTIVTSIFNDIFNLPGKKFAISDHLLPNSICFIKRTASSLADQ